MTGRSLRFVASLASVALLLGGCSVRTRELSPDDLPDVAEETALTPRRFSLRAELPATLVEIEGLVADDQRYRASVAFDGEPTYEEVVVDDRRWVRLLSRQLAQRLRPETGACPDASGPETGVWFEDPDGAPSEHVAAGAAPPAGAVAGVPPASTVLSVVRALESLPEDLRDAKAVRLWNPQAIDYVPSDDRFPPHEGDGARLDALPLDFDPDRVFAEGIPSPDRLLDHFTWTSVWVRDGFVTRIETLVDVPDLSAEIERARRLRAEQTGVDLGQVPPPPVPSSMSQTYLLEAVEDPVVEGPVDAPALDVRCLVPAPEVAPPAGTPAAPGVQDAVVTTPTEDGP